jgi:hypothetical protein
VITVLDSRGGRGERGRGRVRRGGSGVLWQQSLYFNLPFAVSLIIQNRLNKIDLECEIVDRYHAGKRSREDEVME